MKNFVVAFIVVCLFAATAAAQQQQPAAQQPAPQQTVQQQQAAPQQTVQQQQPAQASCSQVGNWYRLDIPGLDSYVNALPMSWQIIIRFGAGFLFSFLFLCGGKVVALIVDNIVPFSGIIAWLVVAGFILGLTFNPCPIASIAGIIFGIGAYRYILTLMPVDEIAG